jgi:hypothetical protein
MAGALEGDVFIGRRAQEYRGLLKIRYPMEHGIVTNWDDMEKIWNWVYQEELATLSEEVRHEQSSTTITLTVPSSIRFSSPKPHSTLEATEILPHRFSSILSTFLPYTRASKRYFHCTSNYLTFFTHLIARIDMPLAARLA